MATANDPLVMQLIRFEFRHIYAIDQIAQTFSARVLAIFVIPSQVVMARGEELCTGLKDEDKPRFRSARWYASMLRFNNMQDGGGSNLPSTNVVEAKDGSLEITLVAEGTFHDAFQLQRFPVDVQDLIVHVTCLCANEKSVPVRLEIPENQRQYKARVDMENFTLSNVWRLENAVMVSNKSIQAKELPGHQIPDACASPRRVLLHQCLRAARMPRAARPLPICHRARGRRRPAERIPDAASNRDRLQDGDRLARAAHRLLDHPRLLRALHDPHHGPVRRRRAGRLP